MRSRQNHRRQGRPKSMCLKVAHIVLDSASRATIAASLVRAPCARGRAKVMPCAPANSPNRVISTIRGMRARSARFGRVFGCIDGYRESRTHCPVADSACVFARMECEAVGDPASLEELRARWAAAHTPLRRHSAGRRQIDWTGEVRNDRLPERNFMRRPMRLCVVRPNRRLPSKRGTGHAGTSGNACRRAPP